MASITLFLVPIHASCNIFIRLLRQLQYQLIPSCLCLDCTGRQCYCYCRGKGSGSPAVCVVQWCAQTVPTCGSYQQNLVGLLLPALAQAISAQENGQTQDEALSDVMPPLLQVLATYRLPFHFIRRKDT